VRTRLIAWSALVLAIAALNYASRFTESSTGKDTRDVVYSYATFAGGLVLYAVWAGIVFAIARPHFDLLALRRPASWPKALGLAFGAIVAIYICEAVVSLVPLPQSPGKEQGLTPTHWEPSHAGAFAANMILFAVVAPFVEELTFRGLGQSLLGFFIGRWPTIVTVGFAFGLAHGLLEALLVLVPFGIALAYVRDRTDSSIPGMLVHGTFNAVALILAVLG